MKTRKRLYLSKNTAESANNKIAKTNDTSTTKGNTFIQKIKEEKEEEEVDNANVAETQAGDVDVNELQGPYALNSGLMYSKLVAQIENTEYEEYMRPTTINATYNSESDDTDDLNWETTSCSSNDEDRFVQLTPFAPISAISTSPIASCSSISSSNRSTSTDLCTNLGQTTYADGNLEKTVDSFDSSSLQNSENIQHILLNETKTNSAKSCLDKTLLSPMTSKEKHILEATTAKSVTKSGQLSDDKVEIATTSDTEIRSGRNDDLSSQKYNVRTDRCKTTTSQLNVDSQFEFYAKKKSSKNRRRYRKASTYSFQSKSGSNGFSHSASKYTKLIHRINEQETKVVELGRENTQLHEQNTELKYGLEVLQWCINLQGLHDMNAASNDYTQQMSALEKNFQKALCERKNLQLALSKSLPKAEFDKLVKEKDKKIDELKNETEKLSWHILQHSNIIEKLRGKEKESISFLMKQNEQIKELTSELEQSKKSDLVKKEGERSHMETVRNLISEKDKLLKDLDRLQSDFEDKSQELKTIQTSFEAAKTELDKKQQEKDLTIDELKNECEELSKQIVQQSNIIKKLREKGKESIFLLGKQNDQIEELTAELELSKKSLSEKDEVERIQMIAAHELTSENEKLLKELESTKINLEETTQKLKTTQILFEVTQKELNEKQLELNNSITPKNEKQTLQEFNNQQLLVELKSMRKKFQSKVDEQATQLQKLHEENAYLVKRLVEEVEDRAEKMANVSQSTA